MSDDDDRGADGPSRIQVPGSGLLGKVRLGILPPSGPRPSTAHPLVQLAASLRRLPPTSHSPGGVVELGGARARSLFQRRGEIGRRPTTSSRSGQALAAPRRRRRPEPSAAGPSPRRARLDEQRLREDRRSTSRACRRAGPTPERQGTRQASAYPVAQWAPGLEPVVSSKRLEWRSHRRGVGRGGRAKGGPA